MKKLAKSGLNKNTLPIFIKMDIEIEMNFYCKSDRGKIAPGKKRVPNGKIWVPNTHFRKKKGTKWSYKPSKYAGFAVPKTLYIYKTLIKQKTIKLLPPSFCFKNRCCFFIKTSLAVTQAWAGLHPPLPLLPRVIKNPR